MQLGFTILLFFSTTSTLVLSQDASGAPALQVVPPPNYDRGWCYYCSTVDAPPLCNSECQTAISNLCNSGDLTVSRIAYEKNCRVQYMPPVYKMAQQGSHQEGVSSTVCESSFNGILSSCGKDASSPDSFAINSSYCTSSGGGGTYGWNDNGEVMADGTARYIITTANTTQCGQAEASWYQSDSVVLFNDSWYNPNDQVVLQPQNATNDSAIAAAVAALPKPNPECDNEARDCDIYDNPYYAESPHDPWPEGGNNMLRHRIVYEGWSEDTGSTRLYNGLYDRCGVNPSNFQAYMNGTQRVADFDLQGPKNDLCWCIPDAIFDASVGITLDRNAFCGSSLIRDQQGNAEFVPVR